MATAVKIQKEDAVKLMMWLGLNSCDKWSNERMAEKLLQVKEFLPEADPTDEQVAGTLITVVAALEDGQDFEITTEAAEPEDDDDWDDPEPEEAAEPEDDDDDWDEPDDNVQDNAGIDDADPVEQTEPEAKDDAKPEAQTEPNPEPEPEAEVKPKKKRGRPAGAKGKKEKKKKEKKEVEPDLFYMTLATEEIRFDVYPKFTVADAEKYLRANISNRPFRKPIATRYSEDVIRKKWKQTLEPIIFDTSGILVSGQHRFEGLILAEKLRLKDPSKYKELYGWTGEVTMPCVLAFGADPEGNDLQDRGQQRSAPDVLFRRAEFTDVSKADLKKLSRDLAVAARLCWLKLGNQTVSDAPHLPHSELIDFIEKHPRLKDMVAFVFIEDAGKEKKIIGHLKSRGYLAALAYLFGISESQDADNVNFAAWESAEEFVTKFAAGTFEESDNPIHQLREWLVKSMSKDPKPTRDMKVDMITKVWKAFVAGETLSAKDMKIKKSDDLSIGTLT